MRPAADSAAGETRRDPVPRGAAALLAAFVLAGLFAGGYELYTGTGAQLFAETHGAHAVPAPLLLALAVIGGGASFFSPCSLAITPSFLAYFLGAGADGPAPARRSLLAGSAWVALGIVLFYGLAGLFVTTVGAVVYEYLIYLIPVVGVGFLVLGGLTLSGRARLLDRVGRLNPVQRYFDETAARPGRAGAQALLVYGAAYGAAAHSCTLPIFLGIVLLPMGVGNYALAGAAVLLYGVAIAVLLVVMALLGQGVLMQARRLIGRRLQQLTGTLFLLTAVYLLHYFWVNYGFFG